MGNAYDVIQDNFRSNNLCGFCGKTIPKDLLFVKARCCSKRCQNNLDEFEDKQ